MAAGRAASTLAAVSAMVSRGLNSDRRGGRAAPTLGLSLWCTINVGPAAGIEEEEAAAPATGVEGPRGLDRPLLPLLAPAARMDAIRLMTPLAPLAPPAEGSGGGDPPLEPLTLLPFPSPLSFRLRELAHDRSRSLSLKAKLSRPPPAPPAAPSGEDTDAADGRALPPLLLLIATAVPAGGGVVPVGAAGCTTLTVTLLVVLLAATESRRDRFWWNRVRPTRKRAAASGRGNEGNKIVAFQSARVISKALVKA